MVVASVPPGPLGEHRHIGPPCGLELAGGPQDPFATTPGHRLGSQLLVVPSQDPGLLKKPAGALKVRVFPSSCGM